MHYSPCTRLVTMASSTERLSSCRLFFPSFPREKLAQLLAGQISAFRVRWIARLRLSLINALTSARVWNGGSVKGAVECSRVNFYGDLNRSMPVSRVSLFLLFCFFFLCTDWINWVDPSVSQQRISRCYKLIAIRDMCEISGNIVFRILYSIKLANLFWNKYNRLYMKFDYW